MCVALLVASLSKELWAIPRISAPVVEKLEKAESNRHACTSSNTAQISPRHIFFKFCNISMT